MEAVDLVRYLLAVSFVLALATAALLVKRYAANPGTFRLGLKGKLGKWEFSAPERRIAIVESLVVGSRQRLLIVRRDNIEHLVLAGPDGATVIESGIKTVAP